MEPVIAAGRLWCRVRAMNKLFFPVFASLVVAAALLTGGCHTAKLAKTGENSLFMARTLHQSRPAAITGSIYPERRSWPRENAKNTKKDALILKLEDPSDFFPLKSFLDPLFAFFAFFCGHAISEFGFRTVSPFLSSNIRIHEMPARSDILTSRARTASPRR